MKKLLGDLNILQIILIVLYLTNNIDWNWGLVLTPMFLGVIIAYIYYYIIKRKEYKVRQEYNQQERKKLKKRDLLI